MISRKNNVDFRFRVFNSTPSIFFYILQQT